MSGASGSSRHLFSDEPLGTAFVELATVRRPGSPWTEDAANLAEHDQRLLRRSIGGDLEKFGMAVPRAAARGRGGLRGLPRGGRRRQEPPVITEAVARRLSKEI